MSEAQKVCSKGTKGCKEQLILYCNLNTSEDKKQKHFLLLIDYQKAYDSVPHDWLIKVCISLIENEELLFT